jgi:hypothetical protein
VIRRAFISLLGGVATMPLAARAQQPAKKMLRVGTVSGSQKSSPQRAAFLRPRWWRARSLGPSGFSRPVHAPLKRGSPVKNFAATGITTTT